MTHHRARAATRLPRSCACLIAVALATAAASCGQLPASLGQRAASRPAAHPEASPSATGVKAPSPAASTGQPVKHADLISGVSCAGQFCTAVGSYYYGTKSENTLVDRWTGSAWQQEPSPDSVRYSTLYGVSCPSSTSCVAVGSPMLSGQGSGWHISASASPFSSVSCVIARFCLAVGMTQAGQAAYGIWRGSGHWHTARLPVPRQGPASEAMIVGVSCATAGFCLAVGNYAPDVTAQPTPASRVLTLAEEWNGRTWRRLPTPNVGPIDQFTAASCVSPADCTAVGNSGQQYPLAEHWNGASWRVERLPLPGSIGYTTLSAVSCGSPSDCMAVGDYQGRPLAEALASGKWRLQWLPQLPADKNQDQLTGVSCVGAAMCMAVGVSYTDSASSYAERWDGTGWTSIELPNPS